MNERDEIEAWMEATASLLGLPVDPAWRAAVRLHLAITREHAERVLAFPLPDEAEPGPVFRP